MASRRRRSISQRARFRPRCRLAPLQGWKTTAADPQVQSPSQKPYETFSGGLEWRVDGSQFPISTTMTGVVLEMEPGALRELHWHPNAAEWQYVLSGEFSVTLFGSKGAGAKRTSARGTSAYIPQGYGHSIENVGTKGTYSHRLQQRPLPDHRLVAMDSREPDGYSCHQLFSDPPALRNFRARTYF